MMRPASLTEAENALVMGSTKHSVTSGFMDSYRDHIAAMEIVAECAKVFIMENWMKVDDWSDLQVVMEDNHPKQDYVEYYKYEDHYSKNGERRKTGSDFMAKMFDKWDAENKKRHNPIIKFEEPVLDPTDGDFSVTVNGRQHLWLSDETVIIIADYIENKLNNVNPGKGDAGAGTT